MMWAIALSLVAVSREDEKPGFFIKSRLGDKRYLRNPVSGLGRIA